VSTPWATRRILRPSVVRELTGLSKATIRRLELAGRFPQRFKITEHAVGYDAGAIEAWIAERLEGQVKLPAAPNPERSRAGRFQKKHAAGDTQK
jgi:predicted DNA-binding transcriptional regulator AlpA